MREVKRKVLRKVSEATEKYGLNKLAQWSSKWEFVEITTHLN